MLTSESRDLDTPTPPGVVAPAVPSQPAAQVEPARVGTSILRPLFFSYLIVPPALVLILILRHFGLVAREAGGVYVAVLLILPIISMVVELVYRANPTRLRFHLRVAQHVSAVTLVIYLTGWGPVLTSAYAFVALENISLNGSRTWRMAALWSTSGMAVGQLAIWRAWAPSFLSDGKAQALGMMGAFILLFIIRMAGATEAQKEETEAQKERAESSVRASEDRFRSLVQNSSDTTFVLGTGGIVTYASPSTRTFLGCAPEELFGRSALDLIHPDDRSWVAERLTENLEESGIMESIQFRMAHTDGTWRHAEAVVVDQRGRPSVGGYVANVRDITERKEAEAKLAFQAVHDPLTGLPNRMMLTDRLNQTLARVRRHHRMCGVLYVDLDRFKTVNDTLGHAVGDQLLAEAADRIQGVVRETDTVARLGGDEFVVLCEDIEGVHHAVELAERVIAVFESPFQLGDDDQHVGASIGIAFSGDGTETAETILANADIAMYRAKNNGRHRYVLFDESMQQWVITQVALEAALRQAIPRGELRLHYQPIVETADGMIRGVEALVRWERPGFGLVAPDSFIPTAEESGLILDIGAWVLVEACRHAAGWARRWPDRRLQLAVNISNRQLLAGNIIEVVSDALARTHLDPTLLTLELTESTLVDDALTVSSSLRELRALGVNLALDDFGTGYSSLTHLRAFPFNIVKIDKSFIQTIGTEQDDSAIVAAVIGLARNLGLDVVAEGVETHKQLALLRQMACRYIQGYLFSPPQPAHRVTKLLQAPTMGTGTITRAMG